MATLPSSPRVQITLERPDSTDYLEVVVQTDNRDMVAFDLARGARKWPAFRDAPILWMTFLAWNAMRRSGHAVEAGKFDEFNDRCVVVQSVDQDGQPVSATDPTDDVDPTQPGHEPG